MFEEMKIMPAHSKDSVDISYQLTDYSHQLMDYLHQFWLI